jgi:threonine dehydratase
MPEAGMSDVVDADDVAAAAGRLSTVVTTTPLHESPRISAALGLPVWLKREDQQIGRSYKLRGAFTVISSLTGTERTLGVVCASAGNHALGVAHSCQLLGVRARVFLPTTTPRQKRQQIQATGGDLVETVVAGHTYDEASAAARADSAASGAIYVHPFDDRRTIAGQGSVGAEIAGQMDGPVGTLVVPVGGGGLVAGIATWYRTHAPSTRIIGAEPAGAPSMTAALAAGHPVQITSTDRFVEGAAVERVGDLTFPIVRDLVDEIVVVDEGAVATEMLELYQVDGIIAEPAGALATAAVQLFDPAPPGPVVCVVSGGNNDVSRYAETIERSLVHEGLRHYFLVTFPQEPGALRHFLDEVLGAGDDIVLFEYVKKSNKDSGPALVGIELEQATDLDGLLGRMETSPLSIERVPPDSPLSLFLT